MQSAFRPVANDTVKFAFKLSKGLTNYGYTSRSPRSPMAVAYRANVLNTVNAMRELLDEVESFVALPVDTHVPMWAVAGLPKLTLRQRLEAWVEAHEWVYIFGGMVGAMPAAISLVVTHL